MAHKIKILPILNTHFLFTINLNYKNGYITCKRGMLPCS
jgi:hypothetical protein